MSLFVLRIAENGAAAVDGRLRVGDEIIEINGINTKEFTHSEAIDLIKRGGAFVRLLIRRSAPEGPTSPNGGYSISSLPQSPSNVSMQNSTLNGKHYLDAGPTTFSPNGSYSSYQPASFAYASQSVAAQSISSETGFQPSRLYGPSYRRQQYYQHETSAK